MSIDIDTIKRKTLVKYPFFGTILASTDLVEKYSIKTAATDGEKIYYNPNFFAPKSESEQVFILAHEVCHIAFDHILRSEGKNSKIWNIATDGVINAFLKNDGLELPKGGVDMPEAKDYDAEELYNKLLQENQNNGKSNNDNNQANNGQDSSNEHGGQGSGEGQENSENSNSQGGGQEGSSTASNGQSGEGQGDPDDKQDDVGHDTHSLWKDAVEKNKKNSDGTSKDSGKGQDDGKEEDKKGFWDKIFGGKKKKDESTSTPPEEKSAEPEKNLEKEKAIEKTTKMGEKKAFSQNRIARKQQLEELRDILARQATGYGDTTNSDFRNVGDIGTASALIPWRQLLKEAVKVDVDWSYQNAGIEEGVVTPYLEEFPLPETEILLDTSGSIDPVLLKNFLRECKNILQTSKVKAGCFDTKFYGFQQIRNENDINNMEFLGGGGTNFDAATNAFTKRVENKIIFTDGMARMPEESMDIIWVVFGGTEIHPKGGKVINIDERQLERLSMVDEQASKHRRR